MEGGSDFVQICVFICLFQVCKDQTVSKHLTLNRRVWPVAVALSLNVPPPIRGKLDGFIL